MRTLVRTACGLVWPVTLQDSAAPRSACPTARNSEDLNSMLAGSVENNPFARTHDDCGCKGCSHARSRCMVRTNLGVWLLCISSEPETENLLIAFKCAEDRANARLACLVAKDLLKVVLQGPFLLDL